MAKYKILVIAQCLKNNVIANFNEVVDGSQFTIPAEELEAAGFIELVSDKEEIPAEELEVTEEETVVVPKKKK